MFDPRIKIDRALYDSLKGRAEKEGYCSVDEYAHHVLEKSLQNSDQVALDEKVVEKQLRGLGYIE